MKNLFVGDKQANEIFVFDGLMYRRAIVKVMTAGGLKRVYSPIDVKTDFVSNERMTLQSSQTLAKSTLGISNTTIPVSSTTGLVVGQDITIADGTNSEDVKILSIGTNEIAVTPITKDYKYNALLSRSNSIIDSSLKFNELLRYTITIS